jgi:hypothetical protein
VTITPAAIVEAEKTAQRCPAQPGEETGCPVSVLPPGGHVAPDAEDGAEAEDRGEAADEESGLVAEALDEPEAQGVGEDRRHRYGDAE